MSMTKREFFEKIKVMEIAEDMKEFAEHQLELLDKSKSREKKPTKTQVENMALKAKILSVMSEKPMTISEIMASDIELGELTNQKISAMLKQLIESREIVKSYEKKKAHFAKSTASAVEEVTE